MWTWRDSNSRPNEEQICFLHAYLHFFFRLDIWLKLPLLSLFFLFHPKSKNYFRLSPILLHRLFGLLRSQSFRAMSRSGSLNRN